MKIVLKEISVKDVSEGYLNDEIEGVVGFKGKLNIRPKYQREFVYKDKQRDSVIETVRQDFPLNVMYWIKNEDNTIVKNSVAPPIDLDKLPFPDIGLIDDRHFYLPMAGHVYKMVHLGSQRGCPRKCSYCCNQLFLKAYKQYIKEYLERKVLFNLFLVVAIVLSLFSLSWTQAGASNAAQESAEEPILKIEQGESLHYQI